jgi:hypothetical protein
LGDSTGVPDCLVVIIVRVVVVIIEKRGNVNTVCQKRLGVGVWDRRYKQNGDRRRTEPHRVTVHERLFLFANCAGT